MKHLGNILGYDNYLIETNKDCEEIIKNAPAKISLFAFDTETNTKIDMSKRDAYNINILHDVPFLLQFGFNNVIYIADLREFTDLHCVLNCFNTLVKRSVLALAQNIKFDINIF